MKKKGRYVVEAAYLVPGICILLVYIVFFTLYAHDHAVCVHTVLETAIRGSYPDGRTSGQIRDDMERELAQKLSERLLWLQEERVEVQVSPVKIAVLVSGSGSFLPVSGIEVRQELYRIRPCETLRRSRWMKMDGGQKNGDSI